MIRTLTMTSTVALMLALAAMPAEAKGIKDSLSDQDLATVCTQLGLGEHKGVTVTSGGTTVTGSVHCEAEDLIVGSDDSLDAADDSDDGILGSDDSDDDSSDDSSDDSDDSSDDDSSDDDSSDDDSSDDDSGSDNSGHGGEGSHD
jgi:hypothetical protein